MKKQTAVLIAVILLSVISAQAACIRYSYGQEEEIITMNRPEINNPNMAVLYEASTDTFMYLKNENVASAPASMTKVMTATLVLDYDPELSGRTVVSEAAVSEKYCYWMDDEHLMAGEEVTVKDLMHYLLIASGNEAATTLAEYVAGDIDTFIGMMNGRAKELGMEKTVFYDPHGLSDDSRTTCQDMIKLAKFAMQYDGIREIVRTKSGSMPVSNKRNTQLKYNTTNRVMDPQGIAEYMTGFSDDILGIKTGSTTVAGLNLLCCMAHDDLTFFSCVMHGKRYTNDDGDEIAGHHAATAELMRWARSFKRTGFAAGTDPGLEYSTEGSLTKNVRVRFAEDLYILSQKDEVIPEYEVQIGRSVKAGDEVGTATLKDEFGNVKSVKLVAAADAETDLKPVAGAALLASAILLKFASAILGKKKSPDGAETDKE